MKILLSKQKINMIHNAIEQKTRFIIVQGPSGSGKTTTIKTIAKNIGCTLEYIENIKNFTKLMNQKTIGMIDLDDKNTIKELLKNKYKNQIIIETRCNISSKELEMYNVKTLDDNKDQFTIETRCDISSKELEMYNVNKSTTHIEKKNALYDHNYKKIEGHKNCTVKEQITQKFNKKQKEDENSYYDDLFSDEKDTKRIKIDLKECKSEITENNLYIIVSFPKVSNANIKKYTTNIDFVNGNLHRLKMLDFYSQNIKNVDFYHFLGKLFYVEQNNNDKKEEIYKLHVKFEYNMIRDYVRANCVSYLHFDDLCKIIQLISEVEVYNISKQHLLILYICNLQKSKPKKFLGFKSITKHAKSYKYIP